MSVDNKAVHFVAGAISGTIGSVVTCPLDVAKTRLQSSLTHTYHSSSKINERHYNKFKFINNSNINIKLEPRSKISKTNSFRFFSTLVHQLPIQRPPSVGFMKCIRHIIANEGYRALFKGLFPTLVGVAPSRAIYFSSYNQCKLLYTELISPTTSYGYSLVHLSSAACAGFICTTLTNPIWMIKTRLQLDNKSSKPLTTIECIKKLYKQNGIRGFYKGLTASYFGISETAIHFVIYEAIKMKIIESRKPNISKTVQNNKVDMIIVDDGEEAVGDGILVEKQIIEWHEFLKYMLAAAASKTIATFLAYPHEVARTRMREENSRYRTFFGTLRLVWKEESFRGLYRGLTTQLIKHIPNTAIVLTTYEAIIYFWCHYAT